MQVQVPRGKTFSIYGGVSQPGEYAIVKPEFRVMDALVLSRGLTSPYIDEIYIYRRADQENGEAGMQPQQPDQPAPGEDVLAPRPAQPQQQPAQPEEGATAPQGAPDQAAAPDTAGPADGRYIIVDGKPVLVGGAPGEGEAAATDEQQQQPMAQEQQAQPAQQQQAAAPGSFEFNEPIEPGDVRVIRVDMESLRRGERRHNIVIRPGDYIQVPDPQFGFFYVGGHVVRPGTYQLTGQKTTLTSAIIAAGMLDAFAVASRTDVVRRVGDQHVYVRVDLKKIFNGQEPDFYMQPNDQVRVGTNALAPYLAALRGAFRATYGFGFLYDRNYGAQDRNRGL